ncbi:Chloride channel protein [Mycena venus]|uniref:Chloride channel protein n=1 Tax=Mycena venus TaxID=2733690 RepID=A0A8H7D3N3_9AGAR|nr:Chloride channel protein [Mycena venus]
MTHEHRRRPSLLANDALDDDELERIRRYEDFRTIDWIQDSILERNRRIRASRRFNASHRGPHGEVTVSWLWTQVRRALDGGQTWFVVSLVGVCIGLNAAIISIITEWLSDIKMGYCHDGWWLNQQFCCWEIDEEGTDGCKSWHPWSTVGVARWFIYVLFAATFAFVAAHLVRSLAKYAAGSGISEIKCILAGFVMQGFLGFATFFIKSITLPLVIASGLSVGKEGPSVHVACCIGSLVAGMFGKFQRSQGKMREIVTAASAAGVAVAFGAPIGGVLFSIEEMSHTFSIKTMWRSFFCALMATVTLSAMNPFRTGKLVLFQVTYDRDWHFFEIIFFIVLGIFGGLYGAFVVKFNLQVAAFRRKFLAKHAVAEAVVLATLTAMIGYSNQFLRIDMTESMSILFRECDNGGNVNNVCQSSLQWRISNSLLLATVIRIGLVVVSYGCKVPAGIFVPSMAIGATFGRMIGIMVKAMYTAYPTSGIFAFCDPDAPCITPGTYAFLGAAAALSGVMRITVTVVVIMFELTGALTYILPTMIVLLVTKAVGDFLGTNGIADEMIRFNGFPFLEKEDHAFNVSVSAVMRKDLSTLNESGMSVKDVEATLAATAFKGFPLVSGDGTRVLGGYIGRTELMYVLERSRKTQDITPDTLCLFKTDEGDGDLEDFDLGGALAVGMEEDFAETIFENTASGGEQIKFWPWVNQTPLTVSPQLPLEIVMQLFKRMGPRVILVEDHGTLAGLVTVKDVLRWIAVEKPEREPSWDERGGLDGMLEEVWTWASQIISPVLSWSASLFNRSSDYNSFLLHRIQLPQQPPLLPSPAHLLRSHFSVDPMALTAEERQRYSRELAEYTMRQFAAARKTLDTHKAAAAKLPALHAARDGSMPGRKGLYDEQDPTTQPDKTAGRPQQLPAQQKSVPT